MTTTTPAGRSRHPLTRYLVIAGIIAAAFFASYQFAVARGGETDTSDAVLAASDAGFPAAGAGSAACACCGPVSTETIEGAATLESDGVQRIAVDTTTGYEPNVIKLQANVPAEITFGPGYGCLAEVKSDDLGFFEDLQSGPKTIALPPLEAGTYDFSCGMEMIFGQIVVE